MFTEENPGLSLITWQLCFIKPCPHTCLLRWMFSIFQMRGWREDQWLVRGRGSAMAQQVPGLFIPSKGIRAVLSSLFSEWSEGTLKPAPFSYEKWEEVSQKQVKTCLLLAEHLQHVSEMMLNNTSFAVQGKDLESWFYCLLIAWIEKNYFDSLSLNFFIFNI